MRLKKAQYGFTLMEILIALAVLAILMSALLVTSGNSVRNATYLKQQTLAQWVAENIATEYRREKTFPRIGSKQNGEIEMAGTTWRWRVEVKKFAIPGLPVAIPNIRQLEILVVHDEGDFDYPLAVLTATVNNI